MKKIRRGYVPEDEMQFKEKQLEKLIKAAEDTEYLLSRGYAVKAVTTLIGNHYLLSERQRMALARSVSSRENVKNRLEKQIAGSTKGMSVYIDGFNTIITLEVALSGSLLLLCSDGTIRDLAGLRGTYHVIDKTEQAIDLILQELKKLEVAEAVFYLDAPVSNSGRLKNLILKQSEAFDFQVSAEVLNDVDRVLEKKEGVVTSDAIILNRCTSWLNLVPSVVGNLRDTWVVRLLGEIIEKP